MQLLNWHDDTAKTPDGLTYTIEPFQVEDDGYFLRLPDDTVVICDHPGYCKDEAERHYAASLVMPLDWQGDDLELCAETPLGKFSILKDNGGYKSIADLNGQVTAVKWHRALYEAKAFCQERYTSLVLSCLNVCRDEYP